MGICVVVGDIPFDLTGNFGGGGHEIPEVHILLKWARDHGTFRTDELKPVQNPARLVADIQQSGAFAKAVNGNQSIDRTTKVALVRWHVYSLLIDYASNQASGSASYSDHGTTLKSDQVWNFCLKESAPMTWNELTESYE